MSLNEVSPDTRVKKNQDTHARQATQVSSDKSSVWNFYVRSSDVISLGNQWWYHQMSCKCPLFLRLLKISHTSKLMKEFSILKWLTLPQFMFLKLFLVVPGLTYASFMTILRGFSGTGLPFVAVLSVQG